METQEISDWNLLVQSLHGEDIQSSACIYSACKRLVLGKPQQKLDLWSLNVLLRVAEHMQSLQLKIASIGVKSSKSTDSSNEDFISSNNHKQTIEIDWQSINHIIRTHVRNQEININNIRRNILANFGTCVMAFPLEFPEAAMTPPSQFMDELKHSSLRNNNSLLNLEVLLTLCDGNISAVLFHIGKLIALETSQDEQDGRCDPAMKYFLLQAAHSSLSLFTNDADIDLNGSAILDTLDALSWATGALLLEGHTLPNVLFNTQQVPLIAVVKHIETLHVMQEEELFLSAIDESLIPKLLLPAYRALSREWRLLGLRGIVPALLMAQCLAQIFGSIAEVIYDDERRASIVSEAYYALELLGKTTNNSLMLAVLRASWTLIDTSTADTDIDNVMKSHSHIKEAALLVTEVLIHCAHLSTSDVLQILSFPATISVQRGQHVRQLLAKSMCSMQTEVTVLDNGISMCSISVALLLRLLGNVKMIKDATRWVSSLMRNQGVQQCMLMIQCIPSAMTIYESRNLVDDGVTELLKLFQRLIVDHELTDSTRELLEEVLSLQAAAASASASTLTSESALDLLESPEIIAQATKLETMLSNSMKTTGNHLTLALLACPSRQSGLHSLLLAISAGNLLAKSYLSRDPVGFNNALAAINPLDGLLAFTPKQEYVISMGISAAPVIRLPLELEILSHTDASKNNISRSINIPRLSPLAVDLALSSFTNNAMKSLWIDLCSLTATCIHIFATRLTEHGPIINGDATQLIQVLYRHRALLIQQVFVHDIHHSLELLLSRKHETLHNMARTHIGASVAILDMLAEPDAQPTEVRFPWKIDSSMNDVVIALGQSTHPKTQALLQSSIAQTKHHISSLGSLTSTSTSASTSISAYESPQPTSHSNIDTIGTSLTPTKPKPLHTSASTQSKTSLLPDKNSPSPGRKGSLLEAVCSSSRRGGGDCIKSPSSLHRLQQQQQSSLVEKSDTETFGESPGAACNLGPDFSLELQKYNKKRVKAKTEVQVREVYPKMRESELTLVQKTGKRKYEDSDSESVYLPFVRVVTKDTESKNDVRMNVNVKVNADAWEAEAITARFTVKF
jgi:hypothetical protein